MNCIDKGCSSIAVGINASENGSTLCAHTCDGSNDYRVNVIAAADHEDGEQYVIDYRGIEGTDSHKINASIPQIKHTYKWFNSEVPFGNENQVFIAENTCYSKKELENVPENEALMDWHTLAAVALQRAKTASEAVEIMGEMVSKYGLSGFAEDYLISDPKEIWVIEIAGNSNIWVAVRIPDNAVIFHANRLRIQNIDFNDHENYRYSENILSWAREKGMYDPDRDGEFSFEAVYSAGRDGIYNSRREYRALNLLCPSTEWDEDALCYPLYVIPEFKIDKKWIMQTLWRDMYEKSIYDFSDDALSGPFGNPVRQMIKGFNAGDYPRPISTWKITYATVCEARKWLPDEIGGIAWFCECTPRNSTYVPLYCSIDTVPCQWSEGSLKTYSQNAYWAFKTLDTVSQIRYREINADIRKVFNEFEKNELMMQSSIENRALEFYQSLGKNEVVKFLTDYSCARCSEAYMYAVNLFGMIMAKYRDGHPETEVNEKWNGIYEELSPLKAKDRKASLSDTVAL